VLISTALSHMREFTLGHLSESRSAPGGRKLVGQAANSSLRVRVQAAIDRVSE